MPRRSALAVLPTLALALALALPLAAARAGGITVFAAASLKTALEDIATAFEAEGHGVVTLSFAGTSALARQIDAGAPAQVVISANPDWMDWLEDRGHLTPGTRRDLLGNALVLIAPGDAAEPLDLGAAPDLRARLDGGRLAMAFVDAVPAGIYGKAALTGLGLWESLSPHVAQFDNVRSALAAVALGEAPLGITYRTDAMAEPRVRIVATFPPDSHPPIIYPAATLGDDPDPQATAFLAFLFSAPARAILVAEGFDRVEN
ncbi:molybdate ABC transporter substrate-binding protein [Pseudooceanicola aestuarii]|uniref:molybdate ABC transporter substrate-binding protein n=1 Tax=Pseudooceanicola aestuarii TaxID=2697319 RepID=UPI0013CFA73A|nr:molybdate ABC transporter substrate-binding protein [Pseudooceanicola aestuarii]